MSAAPQVAEPGPVGTSRLHTSEPRWPAARPRVDPAARHVVVVAGPGAPAAASAAAWLAEAAALGIPCDVAEVPRRSGPYASDPAGGLDRLLGGLGPATRVLVAGDEVTIARTLAACLAAGHVAAEVAAQLTDPAGPRPVQCVHCRAITDTTAAVDEVCTCGACARPLLVFPHFSRRIGAYLGFRADAEELPA